MGCVRSNDGRPGADRQHYPLRGNRSSLGLRLCRYGAYRQTVVHDRIRKATAAAEIEHVELPKVGHSEALAHLIDQQCSGFRLRSLRANVRRFFVKSLRHDQSWHGVSFGTAEAISGA